MVYRTNPHLDAKERAEECAELIVRTINGEIRPVQALEMPPLVVNIVKQYTGEEPMKAIVAGIPEVLARPGILSASVAEGYPYADVEEMGMAFLAIHDGDEAAARDAARYLADLAWERRLALQGDVPFPTEALQYADAAPEGPIVLMDVGDNIGGGSSADSTYLLAEAKRLGITELSSRPSTIRRPSPPARRPASAPRSRCAVGGKTDDLHGDPVTVTGTVRVLFDGLYEDPLPTHGGWRFFDGGTTAVLETTDDHTLVLTSKRTGNTSLEQLYSVGVRPRAVQGRRRQGRRLAAPGLLAGGEGDRAGQHPRRHHLRPLVLHLPPPPQAALPLRARRHLLTQRVTQRSRSSSDRAHGLPRPHSVRAQGQRVRELATAPLAPAQMADVARSTTVRDRASDAALGREGFVLPRFQAN